MQVHFQQGDSSHEHTSSHWHSADTRHSGDTRHPADTRHDGYTANAGYATNTGHTVPVGLVRDSVGTVCGCWFVGQPHTVLDYDGAVARDDASRDVTLVPVMEEVL